MFFSGLSITALADFQVDDASNYMGSAIQSMPDLKGMHSVVIHVPVLVNHGNVSLDSCAPSFGHDLPMSSALTSVVPMDWHIYQADGINMLGLTTWRCDAQTPWSDTLSGVLRQNHLRADLWWDQRVVSLTPDAMLKQQQVQQKLIDAKKAADAKKAKEAIVNTLKMKQIKVDGLVFRQVAHLDQLNQTWILKKDEHLSDVLNRWCKNAGWTLIWKTQRDWVIPALTTYQGDFNQAINVTIESLNQGGALIRATRYLANHTLVIDDIQDLTPAP